jgi:coproporphyrinogen III oxidase
VFVVEKNTASEWFSALRDQIINAFVGLEQSHQSGPGAQVPAGVFEVTETRRHSEDGSDAGGGVMSVLRGGRLFEKVGVNVSTVHGHLAASAQAAMAARKSLPGMKEDPRFWASGISLVAHMQNPHCPAVHMNTRMFWTPHGKRARGVGGIFMDDHCTGDWAADFALTQDIGRAFLAAFVPLIEKRQSQPWSDADREAQLLHRGLYAEYNLVYDRGTKFGLATGHDPDAVLMSLPPLAKWR